MDEVDLLRTENAELREQVKELRAQVSDFEKSTADQEKEMASVNAEKEMLRGKLSKVEASLNFYKKQYSCMSIAHDVTMEKLMYERSKTQQS